MKPLLIDFNLLNRVVRKLSREGIHFKENASKGVTVGAFFDVKRVYPGSLPIGSSKMCGDPDLPEDLTIPTTFSFVCQLNLSELSKDLAFSVFHPGLKKTQFPKKGILYFFVHSSLKRGLVYYYNGDVSKLKRRKLQGKQFKSYECAIKIYEHISMDGDYCIKFIHDEMREWWERAAPTNSFHSLFGYAHPYCSGKGKNYLLQIHRDLDFDFGVHYILYFSFNENIQFNEGFIKVETGTMYEEWN